MAPDGKFVTASDEFSTNMESEYNFFWIGTKIGEFRAE